MNRKPNASARGAHLQLGDLGKDGYCVSLSKAMSIPYFVARLIASAIYRMLAGLLKTLLRPDTDNQSPLSTPSFTLILDVP